MGGKIALGTALVVPFKAKISESLPPAKGELRPQAGGPGESPSDESIRKSRRFPGGLGDGTTGPALPIPNTEDISMDSIMAAVDTSAVAAVPLGDDGGGPVDVETGGVSRGGARAGDSGTVAGTLAVQTAAEEARWSSHGDEGDGTYAGKDTATSPGCKEGENEESKESVRRSWAASASEGDEKQEGVCAPSHEV